MAKKRPPSAAYLEKVALGYLMRHPGTVARVRAMLSRRIEKEEADPALADVVIEKLVRIGVLDDARVAASRVRALRRRGKSERAIRAAMARLGIDRAIADEALRSSEGDDLEAARALVKKKKLGPFRAPEDRARERDRDLARLGRAGFSYEIAARALSEEADSP